MPPAGSKARKCEVLVEARTATARVAKGPRAVRFVLPFTGSRPQSSRQSPFTYLSPLSCKLDQVHIPGRALSPLLSLQLVLHLFLPFSLILDRLPDTPTRGVSNGERETDVFELQ